MPILLELFSGTGSIGKAFKARGWGVFSVDIDPVAQPTLVADVLSLELVGPAAARRRYLGLPALHPLQQRQDESQDSTRSGGIRCSRSEGAGYF